MASFFADFSDREIFLHSKLTHLRTEDVVEEGSPTDCIICFDSYIHEEEAGLLLPIAAVEDPVRLPCGHIIGRFCIGRWTEDDNRCPMCRTELFFQKCSLPNIHGIPPFGDGMHSYSNPTATSGRTEYDRVSVEAYFVVSSISEQSVSPALSHSRHQHYGDYEQELAAELDLLYESDRRLAEEHSRWMREAEHMDQMSQYESEFYDDDDEAEVEENTRSERRYSVWLVI
jgi:hypothetical protein